MNLLIIYWFITTIYGTYWLIKYPSYRYYEDDKYFNLMELIGKLFFASIIAWVFVPIILLSTIKFKR